MKKLFCKNGTMRIQEKIYNNIINFADDCRCECGGILGGKKDNCIADVFFDKGKDMGYPCVYKPDVESLNRQIKKWQLEHIQFMGMFHTHVGNATGLSETDRDYIRVIMQAMPENITNLYFPILVLPQKELIAYRAIKAEGEIQIKMEPVYVEKEESQKGLGQK